MAENEDKNSKNNNTGTAGAESIEKENKKETENEAKKQENKESEESIEAVKKEAEELKDRLLRLAAEFDNYKKRANSDMQAAKDLGKAELIKKLLPALDAFEIAIYSAGNSEEEEKTKGFELVFSEIKEVLKNEGLKEIDTDGKYNPYMQEVVLTKPSEKEEGSVLEVVRKGYMFNDIMLRPASVIISSGKPENKNK